MICELSFPNNRKIGRCEGARTREWPGDTPAVSGEAGALMKSLLYTFTQYQSLQVLFDEEENLLGAGNIFKGIKPKNNSMCSEPIESGSGYSYINKTFR